MHSYFSVFILGLFLQYFFSYVTSDDHVMSLFSEVSDELTLYHDVVFYFENFHVGSVCLFNSLQTTGKVCFLEEFVLKWC